MVSETDFNTLLFKHIVSSIVFRRLLRRKKFNDFRTNFRNSICAALSETRIGRPINHPNRSANRMNFYSIIINTLL